MKGFSVFISYQRADTLFLAHALGYALRLAGHEAFVDTGSIGGGELYPVITDLGRERSSDRSFSAGSAFLDHPTVKKVGPPVIVYAGTWAVLQRDKLVRLGASDVMANREQLINTVLRMLGRAPEEPAPVLTR